MYISQNPQGGSEWLIERSRIVTASEAYKILPPKTGKKHFTQAGETYILDIVAAYYSVPNLPQNGSKAIEWGIEQEPIARKKYEGQKFCEVKEVGLIKPTELDNYGVSVDGLVYNNGIIEIKCPFNNSNHIKHLVGSIDDKYKTQMQFGLYVTGRKWCDFISYNPNFTPETQLYIKRFYPDIELFEIFTTQLELVNLKVQEMVEKIGDKI